MLPYSNINFWSLNLNKTLKITSLMLYLGYWKKQYPNLCINSYISKFGCIIKIKLLMVLTTILINTLILPSLFSVGFVFFSKSRDILFIDIPMSGFSIGP